MSQSLRLSQRRNLDAESRAMLYQGASTSQLAEIFGGRPADVLRKLAGLEAVGTGLQGNPLYSLKDAASRLVKIEVTPEAITAHLKRMNPRDVPPMLSKVFWDSITQRRRYEEMVGELWKTEDVSRVAAETFQSLRMSLLLIPDALMSETEISEGQMRIVQDIIDSALEDARVKLVERLEKPSGGASIEVEDDPL